MTDTSPDPEGEPEDPEGYPGDETTYLLSNPANAQFLREGIAEIKAGKWVQHDLIDPDSIEDVV